jgi:phage anti-repressor protein
MKSQSSKKYMILLPVVFLLLNAVFFKNTSDQILDTILNEKRVEVENHVKMLAALADEGKYRPWIKSDQNIIEAVKFIDESPATFAGAYKRIDGEWENVSKRDDDIAIKMFKDIHFRAMIEQNERGRLEAPLAQPGDSATAGHIYFQQLPMHEPPENRYLIVTNISKESLVTPIPFWMSAGQWGSSVFTLLLNIILVVTLVRNRKTERR